MRSIRRSLLLVPMTAAAVVVALGGAATYRIARDEVDSILDYHLRQVALSVGERLGDIALLPGLAGPDPELDLVIQIWSREGVTLYFSHAHRTLPNRARLGYADVATPDGTWRVFALPLNGRVVQVAQPMEVRRRRALSAALRILVPSLALLPLLAIGIWIAVGRSLRPLDTLAAALANRGPGDTGLQAMPSPPAEIAPVVAALDDLLRRLDQALAAQRAFVADAAHELRTPLAALRLQAQLVERAPDAAARARAVEQLTRGLDRVTHVVGQLLTLARQEPGTVEETLRPVALAALARQAIAGQLDLATAKGVDLGAAALDEAAVVTGDPTALGVMLDNLVENAIRYTPPDGRVDVTAGNADGHPFLEVSDSGPGIPPAERAHVFDRFYRSGNTGEPGSGLGLAIVRAIATRHGADITLGESALGGLRARVIFPVPARVSET